MSASYSTNKKLAFLETAAPYPTTAPTRIRFKLETASSKHTLNMATNPLKPDEVTVVNKSDIAERSVSPVSLMPPTLLNTLTEEEILDLVMYLASGGKVGHTAFQQ